MSRAPIFDGIVNVQHELDQIAMRIDQLPLPLIAKKLQDTTDLLQAITNHASNKREETPCQGTSRV